MNKFPFMIRVPDSVIKWLQDNGIISKTPYRPKLVNKEDVPQMIAKSPSFKINLEPRYIVEPKEDNNE